MKYKITLGIKYPTIVEKQLMNRRDMASFMVGAEEDYILARVLLFIGMKDPGMYHNQQSIEKYLKAYLIQNGHKFDDTHDLTKLATLASEFNTFFADQDFIKACQNVTHFEVIGRYPQAKVRSYGWIMPDLVHFLDEFIYEMRLKVNCKGIFDPIVEIQNGNLGMGSSTLDTSQLINVFYRDNPYFKKNRLQRLGLSERTWEDAKIKYEKLAKRGTIAR